MRRVPLPHLRSGVRHGVPNASFYASHFSPFCHPISGSFHFTTKILHPIPIPSPPLVCKKDARHPTPNDKPCFRNAPRRLSSSRCLVLSTPMCQHLHPSLHNVCLTLLFCGLNGTTRGFDPRLQVGGTGANRRERGEGVSGRKLHGWLNPPMACPVDIHICPGVNAVSSCLVPMPHFFAVDRHLDRALRCRRPGLAGHHTTTMSTQTIDRSKAPLRLRIKRERHEIETQ